ncbi:MAG: hypothetical protein HND46_14950 [Chloroflexi bacterium]|nr:hypothetical protein [Chloroflexota bacterium]
MYLKILLAIVALVLVTGLACATFRSTSDPAPTPALVQATDERVSRITDGGFPSPFGG